MVMATVGAVVFSSLTAMLRYAFIRSSMVLDIQFILKRDSFMVQSVVFGEFLIVINFAAMYLHLIHPEASRSEFILYKACVDPWNNSKTNIWNIFPVGQILFHFLNLSNIICNILLFKYLDKTAKASTALRPLDKKAERKRNLFPARIGIITFVVCTSCYGFFSLIYSLPFLDNAMKAFLTGLLTDSFNCIITPGIIIFGSQTGRRRIQKIKNQIKETMMSI
jgi:hypothetical protein